MALNKKCCICGKAFSPPSPRMTCQTKDCIGKARWRNRSRRRVKKLCLVCGKDTGKYWSKICSRECRAIYRAVHSKEHASQPARFTAPTRMDFDSMIATLEDKGFEKAERLTGKTQHEYTVKENTISWWDKPPKGQGMAGCDILDWEAGTEEELPEHWDGVEQEVEEKGAPANPEQELL